MLNLQKRSSDWVVPRIEKVFALILVTQPSARAMSIQLRARAVRVDLGVAGHWVLCSAYANSTLVMGTT